MGLGIGDFDLDGSLDIFKSNFADDTNILYRNGGHGAFEGFTIRCGLGVETRYVSWGGIVDFGHDHSPDIFLVTGSVYPEVEAKLPEIHRGPRARCSAIWAMENSKSCSKQRGLA